MLKRFATTRGSSEPIIANDTQLLIARLKKLVNHPGYIRDAVVSELLKRYLPWSSLKGQAANDQIDSRIGSAGLDAATVRGLLIFVEQELDIARAR